MRRLRLAVAGLAGYLLGSLPSADVASRLATRGTVDLREAGSGNPGTVNAAEVLGVPWAAGVAVADIGKGAAAGLAGRRIAGDDGAYLAATTAIAGHIWPVWSGFRGGKGVATSLGACLAVFPAYAPIDVVVAGVTTARARHAEAAMRITAPVWVLGALAWWKLDLPNAWGPRPSRALVLFAAAGSAMILARFATARAERPRKG